MKDTGIVRRIDDLGRIVIPMELRRTLGINVKDPIAIFVEGDRIILQKHRDVCALCGNDQDVRIIRERPVCATCIGVIRRTAG
jgi:transcriptional pleiotropic regulator of transition state genes